MSEVDTKELINQELLNAAMSYDEYIDLLWGLFEEGKTTGENQSEELLNYAKMNLQRMKRLNKKVLINEELSAVLNAPKTPKMIWLILTEGWCGDAAQNLPLINKLAALSEKLDFKLILRDKNLEIMDQFLTNGGRSIPKLIALNPDNLSVLGSWGPRPIPAQDVIDDFKKKNPDAPFSELAAALQLWYSHNKTQAQQTELIECVKKWSKAHNK